MGFLDGILKQATGGQGDSSGLGALVAMASQNPQILTALAGLLSSRDTSIGGNAGLAGLVNAFQQKGLGDVISQWVSSIWVSFMWVLVLLVLVLLVLMLLAVLRSAAAEVLRPWTFPVGIVMPAPRTSPSRSW